MQPIWLNQIAGVPTVNDFLTTGGLGPCLCLNTTTQRLYYLATGDVVTIIPIGGGGGSTPTGTGFIHVTGGVQDGAAQLVLAADITDGNVTLIKLANMATGSLYYRKTAGAGAPEINSLATLKTDLLLTGTNSGDQTSIVGISGTLAEFNAALTGADFATGGGTATNTNTGDQTSIVGITGSLAQFNTALTGADFASGGGTVSGTCSNINSGDQFTSTTISVLIGRGSAAGAGAAQEITLGTNLSMSGTTLNAAGGAGGGTVTSVTVTQPAAGITVTNTGVAQTPVATSTIALANDLAALEALAGTNTIYYRSAVDTWTAVTIGGNLTFSAGTLNGVSQYTDELAQDAVGAMVDASLTYVDATPLLQRAALTGHITASAGSNATVLGSFTLAQLDAAVSDANVVPAARLIDTTAPITGGGNLSADLTIAISAATTGAAGSLSAADKTKLNSEPAAVQMTVDAAARGPGIIDYFATTLSLDASSIYEIQCHANFIKTTAGTVLWTWAFSNAPTVVTSRNESTPITGYTGAAITGAPIAAQATSRSTATNAHAASGSLTTAVDHSFVFWVYLCTNLATTIQLRSTESAGTISPRAGSYMRAKKVL